MTADTGRLAAAGAERPVEALRFRRAFRQVPAPVAIVLVGADGGTDGGTNGGADGGTNGGAKGGVVGITCTSASSLSGDPPMALVCVDHKTGVHQAIRQAGRFSVNFLAAGRAELARAFSTRGRNLDALAGIVGTGRSRVPILRTGTTCVLECGLEAIHRGGDHWIVCGLVSHARFQADTEPLIYLGGGYGGFSPPRDLTPTPTQDGG